MAEPAPRRLANPTRASSRGSSGHEPRDSSLGDLVALAVSDLTQLVRCEVDLAKIELKEDARRLRNGAVLLGMAAFVGCLVLMLLCFALAYGLQAAGAPGGTWASFLYAAVICIILAVVAGVIGFTRF